MAFETFASEMFDASFSDAGSEVFVIGANVDVPGIRSQVDEKDPIRGIERKTLITVLKGLLTTWPKKGDKVTCGSSYWSIKDIRSADVDGYVIIECTSTVRNPALS